METIIADEIQRDPELVSVIGQATQLLDAKAAATPDPVKAEWSLTRDRSDKGLINVTLSDWAGSKTASFTRDEFRKPLHWDARLRSLWADMLQERTSVVVKRLHEKVQQLEGD